MKPTSSPSNLSPVQRQTNQVDRIAQGVRSGELTRGETRQLVQQQREIHTAAVAAYKNDGRLGGAERAGLGVSQRQASRDIFELKHNSPTHEPGPSPVDQPGSTPPPPTGLSTNPKDWPEGSVQTEGGYTIVPEGETNWSIYAPGQKIGEEPMTRVHGDPHVSEADGTSWDFTKNSDFVLPDGTRIAATTSAQEGKSVTTGLDITNGQAHVSVTGVNTADPTTSEVQSGGYRFRREHRTENPGLDTFRLNGNATDQQWSKWLGGQYQGIVTGASYDEQAQQYVQTVVPSEPAVQ